MFVVHLTDVFLTNSPLHNYLIVNTVNTNDVYVVEKSKKLKYLHKIGNAVAGKVTLKKNRKKFTLCCDRG